MGTELHLERVEADAGWDRFVETSPNGTIFSRSEYLAGLSCRVARYFCYRKQEVKAAVALIEDDSGSTALLHPFVIYNGMMFPPSQPNQNQAQIGSDRFRVSEFVAGELANRYESVELSLHPTVTDIRPFLWVNYGEPGGHYSVDVRYTSHLDISDCLAGIADEDIAAFSRTSVSRRQEIRYARRDGVQTVEAFDAGRFVEFYRMTMERQNNPLSPSSGDEMERLLAHVQHENIGRMFVSSTAEGIPGSMAVFIHDTKRAYYLFGASDPAQRDEHTGSVVLWDAFKVLRAGGVTCVDLEGVNSPRRGWFKLSFGGSLLPYYEVKYGE
jgi:hypothetical protein